MSDRAVKFFSRAPRYTLSPKDNRYLRFAHKDQPGQTFTTRFKDISQTGLAFICDPEYAPNVSEMIKVEIPLNAPGTHDTIAWWARVVRVEEYQPANWHKDQLSQEAQPNTPVLVAITFHELPAGHTHAIRQALELKFNEVLRENRSLFIQSIAELLASNTLKILFYLASVMATIWLLYFLSQPSGNYDAEKGSPWNERFPNMPFAPGKTKTGR